MLDKRSEIFTAKVTRVLGPDFFEAVIDLGFDITLRKKMKLGSVDDVKLKLLTEEQKTSAAEFFRSRVEGQEVVLRVVRRGEFHYASVFYGVESKNIVEEMFALGLLPKYAKASNGVTSE